MMRGSTRSVCAYSCIVHEAHLRSARSNLSSHWPIVGGSSGVSLPKLRILRQPAGLSSAADRYAGPFAIPAVRRHALVLETVFLHPFARCLRQAVAKGDVAGDGEVGHARFAPADDLLLAQRSVRLAHDHTLDLVLTHLG